MEVEKEAKSNPNSKQKSVEKAEDPFSGTNPLTGANQSSIENTLAGSTLSDQNLLANSLVSSANAASEDPHQKQPFSNSNTNSLKRKSPDEDSLKQYLQKAQESADGRHGPKD